MNEMNMTVDKRRAIMLNEQKVAELENTGEYKVLRKAFCPPVFPEPSGPHIGKSIILDTEATSIDPTQAEIIALAKIPLYYDKRTLDIIGFGECQQSYNEPSTPIPEEITAITGITNDMVMGHHLNTEKETHELQSANILIAHNASYDRVLLERYLPDISKKPWGCSVQDIPWKDFGFNTQKLDYIAMKLGYFYDAHRADADCHALGTILSSLDADINKTLFAELMDSARKVHYTIAGKVPFGKNDLLKAEGFTWNPGMSSWCKVVTSKEDIVDTVKTLRRIAGSPRMAPLVYISNAEDRYSGGFSLNRMPQTELRECMGEEPNASDALMDPWTKS